MFCRSAQQNLSVAYETSILWEISCCMNIDKNNHPEETELDINPSLTLAQTLTLSIGECSLGNFTFNRCYDPTYLIFAYTNSPSSLERDPESRSDMEFTRQITIEGNWRIENKYMTEKGPDGNKSLTT